MRIRSCRSAVAGLWLAALFIPYDRENGARAQTGTPPKSVTAEVAAHASPADEGTVNFNFDQVEIRALTKLVGDITGIKLVVADGVTGRVTVMAPRIRRKEVFPLFVSILESAKCSVVEGVDGYRVVPLAPRSVPSAPVVGVGDALPAQGLVTKVIRLRNVLASEMKQVLESNVGGWNTGAMGAVDETNHLLITDTVESIRRIERIIQEVDQPGLSRVTEVVPLEYAGAEDMADQLNLALAESETRGERLRKRLPAATGGRESGRQTAVVVASPHANSLILVGTPSQMAELKAIIKAMDVDRRSGYGRLNAIFLKYLTAEEAAKSINALLDKSFGKTDTTGRKIAIEASVVNNALMVAATPGDFEVVKALIDQMDSLPQQVHIEVVIAEHSVTDDLTLGVEMAALGMPTGVDGTTLQGSSQFGDDGLMNAVQKGVFPKGITAAVARGTRVDANGNVVASYPGVINIDALRKNGKFTVLSETALETQNNKEASVNIVNQIPILKSTVSAGTGTTRDIIQNIDRVDVGIKLKLTPHVIPGGDVQMVLNPSIEAVSDPGPAGTQFAPTFARRDVTTTVTVPDGKTIVIAGLTRDDTRKVVQRVPILGSIPLVGFLFRHTTDVKEKTNLMIFVTPHVVTDILSAEKIMKQWNEKTGLKAHEQK